MSLTFLDLFAGIGGFRLGMEQAGHRCLGFVEWDKFARKSYEAIHNTEGEWSAHDITKVSDDDLRLFRGRVDVLTGGFPCQAFSVAGNRKGFEDTRGTLFFEIARFASVIKPRYLFLENVKGLLNHDGGNTFRTILRTLDEIGYDAEWEVLNSKDFGVPQNRERVFIIGHLREASTGEVFPITEECGLLDEERMEATACISALTATDYKGPSRQRPNLVVPVPMNTTKDGAAYAVTTSTQRCTHIRNFEKNQATWISQEVLVKEVKDIASKTRPNEEIGITVKENGDIRPHRMDARKSGISELNINHEQNPSHTVTSAHAPKVYGESTEYRIRKLTPRECWRLQGFPDWAFDKAAAVNSDSQLYKQAGNSVTVNVIYEIAKRLR